MDIDLFTGQKTGELIRIGSGRGDWAFVPDPLPPAGWEFSAGLWPLLAEARDRLGTLNGIGQTLPNHRLLLKPLQDRESLRSSSMEGTFATPEELLLFGNQPREPQAESDPANSWKEVWNYGRALEVGGELLRARPLSTVVIKEMHRTLLSGVRGSNKRPGEFRPDQVHIGSDRRYIPPPANLIADQMYALQAYMNGGGEVDPLVRSCLCHYQFEAIHPFIDGNGRVGRALLSLMIQHLLGHAMPWLYLSAYFERYRDEYVSLMFRISTEGAWDSWLGFCLRGTIEQANDAIRRCDALRSLQREYRERVDGKRPRVLMIVEELFSNPATTKQQLADRLGVAFKTAASDIDQLTTAGILAELPGSHHPTVYYAHEIVKVAYLD